MIMTLKEREDEAMCLVLQEYRSATQTHDSFASAHEGYAVILEELDELKVEVWRKTCNRSGAIMIEEATQIAAMGMRFLVDVALPVAERQRRYAMEETDK